MTESTDVREQVRSRYAQAATAVTAGASNTDLTDSLQTVDDCGTSSCCSGDTEV